MFYFGLVWFSTPTYGWQLKKENITLRYTWLQIVHLPYFLNVHFLSCTFIFSEKIMDLSYMSYPSGTSGPLDSVWPSWKFYFPSVPASLCQSSCSRPESTNCNPGAKSNTLSAFVNKTLLEHGHVLLYPDCPWLLSLYNGRHILATETTWPTKPQIFTVRPFIGTLPANPWPRLTCMRFTWGITLKYRHSALIPTYSTF